MGRWGLIEMVRGGEKGREKSNGRRKQNQLVSLTASPSKLLIIIQIHCWLGQPNDEDSTARSNLIFFYCIYFPELICKHGRLLPGRREDKGGVRRESSRGQGTLLQGESRVRQQTRLLLVVDDYLRFSLNGCRWRRTRERLQNTGGR